jgi:hypothetical protein
MGWMGRTVAAALWVVFAAAPAFGASAPRVDFGKQHASVEVRRVARWVMETVDHGGLPFAIVDKVNARMFVFDARGRLRGHSAVLLGQAAGDDSAPQVGAHAQAGKVPLHERTTPAGRFFAQPGLNRGGEHVVWLDYESAFAIHRLRPGASHRDREARLASAVAADHRASLGCVVVPERFYSKVVAPLLGRGRAMVYVLPESRSARELFDLL